MLDRIKAAAQIISTGKTNVFGQVGDIAKTLNPPDDPFRAKMKEVVQLLNDKQDELALAFLSEYGIMPHEAEIYHFVAPDNRFVVGVRRKDPMLCGECGRGES